MSGIREGSVVACVVAILVLSALGPGVTAETTASDPTTVGDVSTDPIQYKVSIDNVTVRTWVLRNTTVVNATVREITVTNLTTENGTRSVTVRNVSVERLTVRKGTLENVTAKSLTVRNRSILDVPGGSFFDPDVKDRVINRHVLQNVTVEGFVIDNATVGNVSVINTTLTGEVDRQPAKYDIDGDGPKPDVAIENGTAENATITNASIRNWSVEEVTTGDDETLTDANETDGNASAEARLTPDGPPDRNDPFRKRSPVPPSERGDGSERLTPAALEADVCSAS